MKQIVAIVGRPNVGKSTLFNRLIEERKSIVDNISGVTRDRIYGNCTWNGKDFIVIDTGGFVENSADIFESAIRKQVKLAIEEASSIIFVVDTTTGITDFDLEVANLLRKSKKLVFLAVNKVDNSQRQLEAQEFWSLGFENTFMIASISGSGTGDLLDAITSHIEDIPVAEKELPKISIIGQPNVGKSTLTNTLLGVDRNIVTPIAGTTRDSIHSIYNHFGQEFILIDTAGIRRKAKVTEDLEFYSVLRAIRALEESDICLIMIDAVTGIEAQDMHIYRLAVQRHKGIVLVVNKWDLIQKETNTARDFEIKIKQKIQPFKDVPIIFISAQDKVRIFNVVETAIDVFNRRSHRIKTSHLNDVILPIIEKNPPPSHRGAFIKIKFVQQLPLAYPAFAFYCNYPEQIPDSYKNFIENKLRANFNLTGLPIAIFFREK
ncbi:MAG: ribosome biogenesis GTPase Der [Saprospiraceae bacterium]|jgi:GTP-binding protein|nr:ribosome biogenesis GTPase Der [Saprospiraceae bacterium]